jgi:hypothetical protein
MSLLLQCGSSYSYIIWEKSNRPVNERSSETYSHSIHIYKKVLLYICPSFLTGNVLAANTLHHSNYNSVSVATRTEALGYWDRGFESRSRHGCLSLCFCVVLSCVGRGLCGALITCLKESYQVPSSILMRLRNLRCEADFVFTKTADPLMIIIIIIMIVMIT